jgi:hypothetical protein
VSPPCGRALHNPHHGHAAADRSAAPPGAAGGAAGVTGSNPSASRGPHTHQRGDWDVHGQRGVLGAGCHLLDAWGCPAYDGPAHQSRTYSRPLARDVLPARMLADHARYFPSISELCGAGGALVHNASVVPCEASSGCELEDFVQCCSAQTLPMPPSRLASWRHQLEWLYGITQAFMAVLMLYLWKKVVWRLLLWSAQS